MGRAEMLKTLKPELFANEQFGVITVKDILGELEKPGRDPRAVGGFVLLELAARGLVVEGKTHLVERIAFTGLICIKQGGARNTPGG